MHNPIICAIDTQDTTQAISLSQRLKDHIGVIKLGLEFFVANGPQGVKDVAQIGIPLFLDLKLHDIPNTVAGAVRAAVLLDIFILTIHISGGEAMLKAAVAAAQETADKLHKKPPLLIGITTLTSLTHDDLGTIGVTSSIEAQAVRLSTLAQKSGLNGVVCSPHEAAKLRQHHGPEFTLITPGVRPKGSDVGDQKRVMTPEEALSHGANFIVIGRPITHAAHPVTAAAAIAKSCLL